MDISYEYYRIFYYVAKYKNLTQAAKALGSNQPNVSRVMKLLEHEMSCSLMARTSRGIVLTPEGERLFSYVKIAVEQLQNGEEELHQQIGLKRGSITIGASETALHLLLLSVIKQFKRNYPDIRLRISNHLTRQAIEAVKNNTVDFAVVATPIEIEPPLFAVPLLEFRDVPVAGEAFWGLSGREVSLKELESYPLVSLGEDTMTYRFYDSFYKSCQAKLQPELEAATIDQILAMIKSDLGIGFLPEIFAKEALEKGEVFRIRLKEQMPSRQICFVQNEKYPLSVAAKELKNLLQKSLQS